MTEREILQSKIQEKREQLIVINNQIIELNKQNALLSDDEQWFIEKIESHPKRRWQRNPNELDGKLVGRIHWNETFKDGESPDVITIERSKVVRVNGEWV